MPERIDQRISIKFCPKIGNSSSEIIGTVRKVYSGKSMKNTHIREWFRRFKNGQTLVNSDSRSRTPATTKTPENVEHVRATISKNNRFS